MTARLDVAAGDLGAIVNTALDTGTREAFTALLTDDVRWGGEQPGGDHECTNRDQAGDYYESLLADGVTLHLTDLQQVDSVWADIVTARMQIRSPGPNDFPPEMAVRLTFREGLICEICILDSPPTIEVLYFDGCPHYQAFLPHLYDLLAEHKITTPVTLISIDNDADAQTHRFLGSPSVRVDGHDVDPHVDHPIHDGADPGNSPGNSPYGVQCRLYRTDDGTTGMPSDQWILDALTDYLHEATDQASD